MGLLTFQVFFFETKIQRAKFKRIVLNIFLHLMYSMSWSFRFRLGCVHTSLGIYDLQSLLLLYSFNEPMRRYESDKLLINLIEKCIKRFMGFVMVANFAMSWNSLFIWEFFWVNHLNKSLKWFQNKFLINSFYYKIRSFFFQFLLATNSVTNDPANLPVTGETLFFLSLNEIFNLFSEFRRLLRLFMWGFVRLRPYGKMHRRSLRTFQNDLGVSLCF